MPKTKVIHIIVGLYVGGAEMMLYKLLCATDREKFEPVVIALMGRGGQRDMIDAVEDLGIRVYTLDMDLSRPTPKTTLRAWWKLQRVLRREKPDVIQGWMYHSNLAALLGRQVRAQGAKLVWAIHNTRNESLFKTRLNRLFDNLGRRFSHLPDGTIYVSQIGREQHQEAGYDISRSWVVPNGFDMEAFAPSIEARQSVREEIGVAPETLLIGLFSRWHPMKDHANFFQSAQLLASKHPDIHFVLAGAGIFEDNAELLQLVREAGVEEQTHFLGERQDMARLMAALDVMALSSSHGEAFPLVLGEAMSCGVPCVATDVGESSTIIGETGLVVPIKNPSALAEGIEHFIRATAEEKTKFSIAARQRIEENFSLQSVTRRYEEIYQLLLAEQSETPNADAGTVAGFGDEWTRYDQSELNEGERAEIFDQYFGIFPWDTLAPDAEGFDLGSGSGRWAQCVAPRVGTLHCVDASNEALNVARKNLANAANCRFHNATVDAIPLDDSSMDFGYSLGVLHHVPDTLEGLKSCVAKLKPGAPFLLYLYYAFDNRPSWYRALWKTSEIGRGAISKAPHGVRDAVCTALAAGVYFPLARGAKLLEKTGRNVESLPLAIYRERSFYTMRTDARDRFGTQLEQRFTRAEIEAMMQHAGLENIRFSENMPFWCVVGTKK
jgi:glycosyltransferase involved in cell wall biosynthesis/ubiquinone/menaquinone biosynthesis C-methylase UbiE